ncbi:MAG: hypothetical protein IMF01_10630 [Proteobacteria bacterium]|nr:hypothetical protein [Pseudomonadota bacterium]
MLSLPFRRVGRYGGVGKLYREKTRHTYKKVTHGKELFDKLDPEVAYQKCLRLKHLLDDMLKMAKEAGL